MSAYSEALRRLEAVVGEGHLLTATAAVAEYAVEGQTPFAVAFPSCPEEVAALLRLASESKLSVLLRGAGSHLYLGEPPRAIGLVVVLTRLNRVVAYDPDDLTVTAQAGMSLGELQRVVGEHRQMLPLDPAGPPGATLGGLAAANLAGPLRMRYGSPRDLVIGMRVALPTGEVIKAGGRTVKNVAGYDLGKLFLGSLGTLGAMVELTLRLTPRPARWGLAAAVAEPGQAAETAARLVGSAFELAACHVLNGPAAARLRAALPLAIRGEAWVLLAGLLGDEEAIAHQQRELAGMLGEGSAFLRDEEAEAVWARVRAMGYPGDGSPLLRLVTPISRVAEMVAQVSARPGWSAMGQAGDGWVYARAPAEAASGAYRQALGELRAAAEAAGGYAVLEAGPVELKRDLGVWGKIPNLDLMRALKEAYDPADVMGCGRLEG